MKVRYQINSVQIEVDGKDTKDCFAQLAASVEVFGQQKCGCCGCDVVVPVVRDNQGNTYYEMRCTNCGASLGFGQRKQDGHLYPKRRDKDGGYLDNGGWLKWAQAKEQRSAANDSPF